MFELLKSDPDSKARLGRLTTAHGVVDTPVFMPVGTQGSVKALDPRELREMGTQIILGILTVLSGVAIWLAVLHQATGALLVAATVWGAHELGTRRR